MPSPAIRIASIHIGRPRTFQGPQGPWTSSIARQTVAGPVRLNVSGLQGDEVADKQNHGALNMAVCCQAREDFAFWNQRLGLELADGSVGENWTLEHACEDRLCLLDVYDVGTARVQVSKPRVPCQKQAWRVGRADWVKQVLRELRTGFYLQVLKPGTVQAGDVWRCVERPYPQATVTALNRCAYHAFDAQAADAFLRIPHLDPYWIDVLTKARRAAAA